MAKDTAVAKPEPLALVPEHMRGMAGLGTEGINVFEDGLSIIRLLQALSPEVQQQGEKAGTFWHTVAEENLGESLRVIPIWIDQSYVLWRPREDSGGILARAVDGIHWTPDRGQFDVKLKSGKQVRWRLAPTVAESGLDAWGSSDPDDPNSQPAATRMINVVVALPDFPKLSPVLLPMQRSQIRVARKFLGKIRMSDAPSFGQRFVVGTKLESGKKGTYYNFTFTQDGFVMDADEFTACKGFYEQFKAKGVTIRGGIESLQPDGDEVPEEVDR